MRSLAFSCWVCALLASSPAIAEEYLTAQGVYDLWNAYCEANDPDLASRCDSAADYYAETGQGFGRYYPYRVGTFSGQFTFASTNGLTWVTPAPLWVYASHGGRDPEDPASMVPSHSDIPLPSNTSALVSSIWGLENYRRLRPQGFFVSWLSPVVSFQPYGRLLQSSVSLSVPDCTLCTVGLRVNYAPYWWASWSGYAVSPQTFYEISLGRYPSEYGTQPFVTIPEEQWDYMLEHADVQVLERWK